MWGKSVSSVVKSKSSLRSSTKNEIAIQKRNWKFILITGKAVCHSMLFEGQQQNGERNEIKTFLWSNR